MNRRPPLRFSTTAVLGLPLLLVGCNLAPSYSAPNVDAPTAFRETPAPSTNTDPKDNVTWSPAEPADAVLRTAWWELFNDPQLNQLEAQVNVSNQTIAANEAAYRAARAAVASARSGYFPQITAAPSYTRSRASQTVRTTTGSTVVNDFALPVDATYEVDLWGRVRNTVAVDAAKAQASAADLATARLSIQTTLAQTYFQLRAIDAQRQILADTVSSYRESLKETQALFRAGIDSEEDVSQAQTQLDTTIAQATDLDVTRASYEHAIAVLIGQAPANFSVATATFDAHSPSFPLAVPSRLLERRPDIASAERQVAAANSQIGVARAAYFPSLTLGASAGFESSSFSHWFNWPSRFWSIGPEMAASLFDGGARRAATEQASALRDEAAANYRQTVLTAFQDVEDNLAALRILSQEVHEQQNAVNSSRHLLDLATTRFKTGIDSYLNVITAQTTLLSNRESALQVQLRQITASLSLIKALGGGWDTSQLPGPKPNLAHVD